MRHVHRTGLALAAVLLVAAARDVRAQETARAVADGGVFVPGWTGKIDAREAAAGEVLEHSRFAADGSGFHITTGPAATYWNPANRASGDYTVRATFTEPKYMSLNSHPHPYGIVVGGSDLGTDQQRYLYCAAYGNGNFIVRGFGPEPFQLNGRRGEANAAVHTAAAAGAPVTQEIAVSVTGDRVTCAINGTVVASYAKADVVGPGKLASTDGVYGIRMAHNTEAVVTGFAMTAGKVRK